MHPKLAAQGTPSFQVLCASLYIAWTIRSCPLLASLLSRSSAPVWTIAALSTTVFTLLVCLHHITPRRMRLFSISGALLGTISLEFTRCIGEAKVSLSFIYLSPPANIFHWETVLCTVGIALGLGTAIYNALIIMPYERPAHRWPTIALLLVMTSCWVLISFPFPSQYNALDAAFLFAAALASPQAKIAISTANDPMRKKRGMRTLRIGSFTVCCGCLDGFANMLAYLSTCSDGLLVSAAIGAAGVSIVLATRRQRPCPLSPEAILILGCTFLVASITLLSYGTRPLMTLGFLGEKASIVIIALSLIAREHLFCLPIDRMQLGVSLFLPIFWISGFYLSQEAVDLYHQGAVPSLTLPLLGSVFGVIAIAASFAISRNPAAIASPNAAPLQSRSPLTLEDFIAFYKLTPREADVLRHLCNGYSLPAISNLLDISFHTVDGHTRHIYKKTGVHRRDDLLALIHTYLSSADKPDVPNYGESNR